MRCFIQVSSSRRPELGMVSRPDSGIFRQLKESVQ